MEVIATTVDLSYITHSLHHLPAYLMHIYYVLLGSAGLYHSLFGLQMVSAQLSLPRLFRQRKTWNWIALGAATLFAGVVWVLSLDYVSDRQGEWDLIWEWQKGIFGL